MAEIQKKPIKITETILRDAHQSLIATRMTTEQMVPIIEKMDKVGYHSVECWGGATFDASLRFLHEDPWDRLRKFFFSLIYLVCEPENGKQHDDKHHQCKAV